VLISPLAEVSSPAAGQPFNCVGGWIAANRRRRTEASRQSVCTGNLSGHKRENR
jgi:hypothetical protein